MSKYTVAVYPGDGIGIEVTREAVKLLCAIERLYGKEMFNLTECDWGTVYWERTGSVVPNDYLNTLRQFDAVYLGALGNPAKIPDHISLKPLIEIRQSFDQYVCLRPATLLPGLSTPLAGKKPLDIDMMVVRENSEGEYAGVGGVLKCDTPDEIATEVSIHTRKGIERILRYGFELAAKRKKRLAMATKSNVIKFGMVLWDRVLSSVAPDYPDVQAEKCHIDALAMNFVRFPERYDVVVASNLFGDILSDIAGTVSGGLGLAPSANINPERKHPSLFEPVHGSAPDIAGRGVANPVAAIRSAAMMLDFLGEPQAAELVNSAVAACLEDGLVKTPDLGGTSTTQEMGDDIARRLLAS
ncbi:MAG TPA: 3-isopropylmalate dehydrogenase [Armatimonadetes bacterium]|nr:3-isopropylmalate dehydrogenase [Armatimonadota bacterium]